MINSELEMDIQDIFDTSGDITNTIWHTPFETLYDAIIRVIEEHEND